MHEELSSFLRSKRQMGGVAAASASVVASMADLVSSCAGQQPKPLPFLRTLGM